MIFPVPVSAFSGLLTSVEKTGVLSGYASLTRPTVKSVARCS